MTGDLSLPPTNLVTSEVTPRSFRVSWTAPAESVDRYRIEYYPAAGGTPQEVRVESPVLLLMCVCLCSSVYFSPLHFENGS